MPQKGNMMADQKQEEMQRSGEMGEVLANDGAMQVADTPIAHSTATVERDYAYYQAIFRGRRMPFAYLDLDLLDQNIQQIVERAAGKRVRLASKSLRSVAVLRRILAANGYF